MKSSFNFTLNHYNQTIQKYKDAGYSFDGIDFKSHNKSIIMIHDVDHEISLCNKFLKEEVELNIRSTYFLRLHAKKYNMLSDDSICMARKILDSGCDIGLHYEPAFCPTDSYNQHIRREMNILSEAIGTQIKYFNLHEPARTGFDLTNVAPEINRCPQSEYYKDYKYISDSSCNWREGCFSEHINKWDSILVLTHPLWWYDKRPSENY